MTELRTQLLQMAQLQERLNLQVHPQWREQGHAYYRAIWIECAELLDHFGWKWWKHQRTDLPQVKLEIVDIWHFGLSELLRDGVVTDNQIAEAVLAAFQQPSQGLSFPDAIEALAQAVLAGRRFELAPFVQLLHSLPLPMQELYQLYIGKNVLNGLRQDQGYQQGTYRKVWQGRDDNEHLVELAAGLQVDAGDYAEQLYAALLARYQAQPE